MMVHDHDNPGPTRRTKSSCRLMPTTRAFMSRIKVESPAAWDELNALAEDCVFTTRHYGGGQFFTWATCPSLPEFTTDPWPAARWPKAALCVAIAMHLARNQQAAA